VIVKYACIGESMVELTRQDDHLFRMGFAGDTYNTAVYLARLGRDRSDVTFVTAMGDDWLSEKQRESMKQEGVTVNAQSVRRSSPALYIVTTDDAGERSFTYYRDSSPVKQLFADASAHPPQLDLKEFDYVYFSAITLQVMTPRARGHLVSLLEEARSSGVVVVFDTNYRAQGWPSAEVAATEMDAGSRVADIILPSLSDEHLLHPGTSVDDVILRYSDAGATEIVVKDGPGSVVVHSGGETTRFETDAILAPVDTTGAGDSFNAGYLHLRARGAQIRESVHLAQKVAAAVIAEHGAIVDRQKFDSATLLR
jgi:2-dehydro-3-deoxygluconokinase